jgi:hypothetical protein
MNIVQQYLEAPGAEAAAAAVARDREAAFEVEEGLRA